jgi:hypothetical protein
VNGIRSFLHRASVRIGRPSSPRGWVAFGAVAVGLAVLLVAALAVGAVAAATFYDQYGAHQARNAREWASLTPQYAASSGVCAQCHATEYAKWSGSKHVAVGCQTCHGALAEHAATAPAPESAATIDAQEAGVAPAPSLAAGVGVVPPTDALCTVCHRKTLGRPADFPQVDPTTHFAGTSCLQCHDVHTAIAIPPPVITHSLENVPACTACHGTTDTNGVKAMPAGHKVSPDAVCLSCHKPTTGAPQARPSLSTNP